jgi:hypothetical protein
MLPNQRDQGAEIRCGEFSRPLRVRQLQHEGVDVHVPGQQGDQCQWRLKGDSVGGGYWSECNKYLKG